MDEQSPAFQAMSDAELAVAASHLQLLEAAAGRELVARSYRAALAHDYFWHEFGDST